MSMKGLRRFVEAVEIPPPPPPADELCEFCRAVAGSAHGHVVDTEKRALLCSCRPCYLLFAHDSGRYRAVPDRYLAGTRLSAGEWEGLGIPVGSAFFLVGEHGTSAFYPSPAGATECLLNLDAWQALRERYPLLTTALPEVEAVLVRDGECFLVPVDVCYQLVGLVRTHWKGFDGGTEAHQRIDEFFAAIRARAHG
ncbi:DUF5947 family protein [Actinophytocola sp.]|uniref:DUF5947 family protein n=1 Tax=Actinophytocola sp. TaxID=1872138 RepID=UPI00389B28B8